MNGFERRREEKRRDIKEAALKLFSKNGVKAVTIKMIAKEASVSQVSIYNFFNSKEELVKILIGEILDKKIAITQSIISSELSFEKKINSIIEMKVKSLKEFRGDFLTEFIINDKELQKRSYEINSQIEELVLKLFQNGKDEGYISSDIDNKTLLIYFNVFRNGLDSLPLQDIDDESIKSLIKLFFNSIKKGH